MVGCSSHYIGLLYMDNTIIITRVSPCLSVMNIHGARRAESRRRKTCRLHWRWAAAYVQRAVRAHIVRPRAQLVILIIVIINPQVMAWQQ